uniref:Sorting nexin 11 n=1 Tax=Takifugu rubripes TaxID=31033 RepID=Q1KKW6_TAKRU|nr:sorting nexin 11 [Takifugu rubripes]
MVVSVAQEFIAVRVQDPRVQNEGSWNSHVDYKIFLHTNSKAFTAKTSCVRRRYSEFSWLKKQLQKNAGLVPVPDLPAKSLFYFSNEDFLEGRRKGLQAFLDKVLHMTVCLSDSQLHLFLQTQLPVGHILDCVQGHTPYTVTDAILTYASSNQGLAQAQEDEPTKESSLAVSYESMESPVPHQPSLPTTEVFRPDLLPGADSDHVELFHPASRDGSQLKEKGLIRVLQNNNQLEAVLEECGAAEVSFFLGDNPVEPQSPGLEDQSWHRSCQIQTPVEVHSAAGAGFEDDCELEESVTLNPEEETVVPSDPEEQPEPLREAEESSPPDSDLDRDDGTEKQVLVVERVAEVKNSEEEKEPELVETPIKPEIDVDGAPPLDRSKDAHVDQREADEEADEDEDGHSVLSSNESIIKVSDEESACDEAEDVNEDDKCYLKTSGEEMPLWTADDSIRNIIDLHLNGCPQETERASTPQDVLQARELQSKTDASDLGESVNSPAAGADLTENSDFSIIETSCSPGNS